jgi:two-component system chemotaxis response regulator CheY
MAMSSDGLNIVIADDDGLTRSVLRMILQDRMHEVVAEAADGEKAVESCVRHQPDIAFIDIDMPRLDGHQATRRIRDEAPQVKVIMISALATLDNVQTALQSGALGFVVKPFNAVKVFKAIDDCTKHKRQ